MKKFIRLFVGTAALAAAISFYNTNDYALQRSVWQFDQLLKPDQFVSENGSLWDYGYNGFTNDPAPWNHFYKEKTVGITIVNFDIVNILTNRYETMAYAAEPYTTAVGATPNVGNLAEGIDLGSQDNGIWPQDTATPSLPYSLHFWHSAEFRGDYWQQQGYWNELLGANGFHLK